MSNLWQEIRRPIFALAPMADVTDAAFRQIIAKYGKPDVMWTEFVSADGLVLAPEAGRKKLLKNLEYSESERPIIAQFFTSSPENMKKAAKLAYDLGFDGVDINMGCPDRSVEGQGAGALLMKNVKLAKELIKAAKEGAQSAGRRIPVSIKTRTGYSRPELNSSSGEWLSEILEEDPAVIIIHARTRKEMSKVPAQWEYVKRAVDIRNASGKKTLIMGNGDVKSLAEARKKVKETGCDGVMLGRAIFGNPFLFSKKKCPEGIEGLKLRLKVLVEHTKLFEKLSGSPPAGGKNFAIMKKHFKAYLSGFNGVTEWRAELMKTSNADEVERVVFKLLKVI